MLRSRKTYRILVIAGALAALATPAAAKLDAEALCEKEKVRRIGEYGRCRQEAALKAHSAGTTPSYETCDSQFAAVWGTDCAALPADTGVRKTTASHTGQR